MLKQPLSLSVPSPDAPRILVVDDDLCMRGLLHLHLANAGYDVEMAEDAVVAMKSLLRRPPELMTKPLMAPDLIAAIADALPNGRFAIG